MVNPNRTTSPLQQQSQPLIATGLPSHQQKVAQQLLFADNFWGEKINGFDLLCANLKHSLTSVKELEQFLRDCASSEDSYAKVLNKLVATSNKFSTNGTFAPLWSCLRELNEKFASAHLQLVHQLQELIKDIQKYIDELSKKIKKIRENEVQTQTVVGQFQEIQLQLQKSKEAYHNLCIEFDKARRQLDPTQLASYQQLSQQQVSTSNLMSLVNNAASTSNAGSGVTTSQPGLTSANSASALGLATNTNANNGQNMINTTLAGGLELASTAPVPLPQQQQSGGATDRLTSLATSITANRVTQLLKIEKKVKLALEDYKSSIEKYNQIRVEYERKLADSCNHFQYAEETHLKQMRTFIDVYAKLVAAIQLNKQQIYTDFSARLNDQYTVDYLMQTFIENKRTGQERPDVAQFIEVACNPFNNPPITNSTAATQLLDGNDYSLFLNNTTTNAAAGRVTNSPLSFNQQITNRTNDQLDSNASLRSTPPVYFSTSNLTNNSQMYSQLTNSVSTTTLNAINQQQQHQIQNSNSTSISPFNGPTSTTNEKPAKNDSSTKGGGLNIFNVDFLSRKNRERKEKKNAAAAAAAASTNEKSSKFSRGKKSKQNTNNSSQYENLGASNALNTTLNQTNGNLSVSNHSNKDSSSINSEDSTEQQKINDSNGLHQQQIGSPISHLKATNKLSSPNLLDAPTQQTLTSSANQGSNTARSISSIGTSSLSFDLLDQLKISSSPNNAIAGQTATSVNNGGGQTAGGSDVDSEGYSIRPADACSLDLRSQNFNANSLSSSGGRHNRNKDNDDMNNFYNSSSTSNSDDSDSDAGDSIGPVKVMLKIKPKSEVAEDAEKQKNNTEVLKEISKCLQLKPSGSQLSNASNTNTLGRNAKSRAYYYNYGTSAVSASNSNSSSTTPTPTSENPIPIHTSSHITRSVSVGNVVATNTQSLLDLDFSKAAMSQSHMPINKIMEQSTTSSTAAANNLYNIDEDKEVESSFNPTYPNQIRKSSTVTGTQSPANNNNNSNSSSSTAANGRFTPACFPGRTTPDFRHTTSLFEQQGTRASIVSPLTINGGSDIIPIAIAFNETIHAYFKMGDSSKFKVKCFGCMKISFPFAILKLLAIELPQLEFRLTQLQIANQDLKINNQLLQRRIVNIDSVQSSSEEDLTFEFIGSQLTHELKQQHQQNKQAAFFNFELLKYEFKYVSQPPPLVLNASWACIQPEEHTFELCLDYVFQFRKNLSQVNFMVILPLTVVWGDQVCKVNLLKSEPNAATQENENKLQILWQVTSINSSSRITAKFNLSAPGHAKPSYIPSSNNVYEQFYQPVYVKFHIDNETLSQVKLQILSPNYKLSLLREKIETGKYFCNYDQQSQQASTQNQTQPTEQQKPIQSSSSELQSNTQSNEESSASPPPLPPPLPIPSNNQISNKKTPAAGSLSTHIGSTVDVLLNY